MKGKESHKSLTFIVLLFFFFELFLISRTIFGHWQAPVWKGPDGQVNKKRGAPNTNTKNPKTGGGVTPPGLPGEATPPVTVKGGGGTTARPRRTTSPSFERWEYWWECNKDQFLNLKAVIHGEKTFTGSLNFFLGKGDVNETTSSLRPSAKEIRSKVVPALCQGLKDSHFEVRANSALALGKVGNREDLFFLLNVFQDKNQQVRESAALALGLLQEEASIPFLSEVMKNSAQGKKLLGGKEPSTKMRCFAALGLGFVGKERAAEHLVEAAKNRENQLDLRTCACAALGTFHSGTGIRGLAELLADPGESELIRSQAAVSLGKIRGKEHIPLLLKVLDDKKLQVQRSAVISLGLLTSLSDSHACRAIQKLKTLVLKGKDYQSRCWALLSLAHIGGEDIQQFLLHSIKHTGGQLNAFTGLALSILASKTKDRSLVHDALEKAVAEIRDSSSRSAFCIALGIAKDRRAARVIEKIALYDGDPSLREFASLSLGMMEAKDAAKTLESVLKNDPMPYIIRSAAIGMGLLSERKVVSVLIDMANKESGNLTLKSAVLLALGYVGDRESLEPLAHILAEGKHYQERSFAAIALGKAGERSDVPILSVLSGNMNYRALSPSLQEVLYLF